MYALRIPMRTSTLAQLLAVFLLCCALYLLLSEQSAISDYSIEGRWIIHNGFCVRPYLHAGHNVTIRLLSDDQNDLNDLLLRAIPRDDPQVFLDDLTLLSHSSASALDEDYLSTLLSNWRGPISLAVSLHGPFNEEFVRAKIERTLRSLQHVEDASRLAVHVIFERNGELSCEESANSLRGNVADNEIFFASYPINTVRNVARLFSATRYIAFADADYLFSAGFYAKMLTILRNNVPIGSMNALLYRIFEVEEEDSRLKNHQLTRGDMKELIDADKARVFHGRTWGCVPSFRIYRKNILPPQGHSVPMLAEWLTAPESERPGLFNLTISLKNRPVWEFQFAGLRDVPLFEEDFPYRADNNLELRWEMCRAGYRLLPVEELFVYHTLSHGQNDKDDITKKNAMRQMNNARHVIAKEKLIKRLQEVYPNTKNECPV